jgi:hypothetical protein
VKAELNKLGEAPRAYLEKLNLEGMSVDNANSGRLTLDQRFDKIQGARPKAVGARNGKTLRVMNRQGRRY